ncbi:uncharacterized protein N7459_004333 [Penicillium hispanicum]|uniref:uncharacterized protein n=1 Tax=Penicillium hispanicum TaxID=1080232 RepID=UPI0025411C10|nr:uncharacterized protein N7459_004333 [Penicillium hispanicum]KAJ5584533.1 hypothetical protein N7459_004333 [Penicillium hispanicum]
MVQLPCLDGCACCRLPIQARNAPRRACAHTHAHTHAHRDRDSSADAFREACCRVMRGRLCSGRFLRTGRRPINSPPWIPLLSSASRVQTRLSSTGKALTPEEYKFFRSFQWHIPPPAHDDLLYNEDCWMPHLLQYLPPKTKNDHTESETAPSILNHADQLSRSHTVMAYLERAKKMKGLHLLVHLGFKLKDWSAVYSFLNSFVDTYELVIPYVTPLNPPPGLDWHMDGKSLDHITSLHSSVRSIRINPLPEPESQSLNNLTSRPTLRIYTDRIMSQMLSNLGSLVLAAADHPPNEAQPAMSCVFRILARLHHMGWVSDRVYHYKASEPNQVSFRPPGLRLLSSYIMNVLSDAAWLEHQAALSAAATKAGEDPPYIPFAVGVRELGHEVWLELILWCCVEHGFADTGSYLVSEMAKRTGSLAWKIESWAPLVQALDVVQQTDIRSEQFWRRPGVDPTSRTFKRGHKPPFRGLGERTISREVVESLRSGLANHVYNGVGFFGFSPSQLLETMDPMSVLLDPPQSDDDLHPTNKTTNWDVNRILGSGCLRPADDPVSFERLLRSSRNAIPPWEMERVVTLEDLDRLTTAQLYDETAAMVGLLEFNIKTYTARGQAARAFHQFAWLQNIVDASKVRHIEAFFDKLSHTDSSDVHSSDLKLDLQAGSHLFEPSLPFVSHTTLAELLDLAVSSRTHGFGEWLLFNDDIDGPSITPRSYHNQALAPSILRFAAATQNWDLSERVIESLEPPLSINTLKAIATFYMSVDDWDRAILTLEYLRDFKLNSWGFSNISALAAKLIRLDAAVQLQRNGEAEIDPRVLKSFVHAKNLLRRFYAEEFNTPKSKQPRTHEFQRKVLQRQRDIFLTLPGIMSDLAKEIKLVHPFSGHEHLPYVPPTSFQTILSAVVEVHGSMAGKQLWTRWCQAVQPPQVFRQREGGVRRLSLIAERPNWREVGDPDFRSEWFHYMKSKAVGPDLNGIRIITRAALKEHEEQETMPYVPLVAAQYESPEPPFVTISSIPTDPRVFTSPAPKRPTRRKSGGYKANIPLSLFKYQSKSGGDPPDTEAEAVLDFCVFSFLRAGIPEKDVELEVPGHMQRLRMRGVFKYPEISLSGARYYEVQDDPWMQVFIADVEENLEAEADDQSPGDDQLDYDD